MVIKNGTGAREANLLLVDDEITFVETLGRSLADFGFRTTSATSLQEAREALSENNFDVVVTDLVLGGGPGRETGVDLIRELRQKQPNIPVIVFSAYAGDFADDLRGLGVSVLSKSSVSSSIDIVQMINGALAGLKRKSQVSEESQVVRAQAEALKLEDIRRVFVEEAAKLIQMKEHTLIIPGEGQYDLPKPLVGFKKDLERQMLRYPFEKNVFLMMKFRPSNLDIAAYLRETLQRRGFLAVRADDVQWNITRSVYNPIAVLYCCKYGIALFDEPEKDHAYSPNVAYELGMMHQQNKECLILRHSSLPSLPFDLIKDLHVPYERELQLRPLVERWLESIPALE